MTPLLAAAEGFPTMARSSTFVEGDHVETSRPTSPNAEHHVLSGCPHSPIENAGMVSPGTFNAAMIPLQFGIQNEAETHLNMAHTRTAASRSTIVIAASTALPDSPNPTSIALPSSRAASSLAMSSTRQSGSSEYDASSFGDDDKSPPPTPLTFESSASQGDDNDVNILKVTIAELVGEEVMSTQRTIPADWALTDMVNYIIENEIQLPTEEDIEGDRAANAASLPFVETRPFYDEYEAKLVEFSRANPGFRYPNGLNNIGESIYYDDPQTGKMKKRPGTFKPADPRHPVNRAAAATVKEEGHKSPGGVAENAGVVEKTGEMEGAVEVKEGGEEWGAGSIDRRVDVDDAVL
ncbi:MAG: hypothetical protein Q9166_003426 [cf. Caloplaca sp. 2 TL-2023]